MMGKMLTRWKPWLVLWCVVAAAAEDTPPGLVSKDSEQDLVAEASHTAPQQAQKREAALSNSYGEPLPANAYGPPSHIPVDLQQTYGVPEHQNNIFQTPPGAYGPPSPVVFPSQGYEGPPPPVFRPKPQYGPPKTYGPPKPIYGPPKPIYGPPKKNYGIPKQSLPKPVYGAPFKPPKISFPKPVYGVPKHSYGPPKPVYGPPNFKYGAPLNIPAIPLDFGSVSVSQNLGFGHGSVDNNQGFGHLSIDNNIDLGQNLPAPIYGTPFPALPQDLKPNFPIPEDTYGPPGHILGPIGPNDQVVVHGGSNVHYGPPQPDPNPKPPHPGIPAPPTPPHVLYDGWKPIPGVSKPIIEQEHHEHIEHAHGPQNHNHIEDQYGPPPPPPPPVQEIHLNLDGHSLPNIDHGPQFSGAQINTGYSSVHQDALANIDLNAIVGGDSNHIDQSKTVFEAHYTETHNPQVDLNIISASIPSAPSGSYGPPISASHSQHSHGHFSSSIRQQGAKGLVPPSGVYGVPPGSQYGAPPRAPPSNLPIPYGSYSGGGHSIHTGGNTPKHPIKFRDSVPEGLIAQVGQTTHHKDVHGINEHSSHGPQYLPPPVRDVKDVNQQTGNHGIGSLSISIEPSNLYSLPHSGNSINFQNHGQPSNLYGSPYDSYSVPLFTVGDNTGSASSINEVKASLDGTILSNLTREEVEAILKHCPYHEAILKAAKFGDKIPSELASSYVASLSSLGSTLSKSQQTLISPHNGFNTPVSGSESVSYNSKDLQSASHTLVQTILPNNDIKQEKTEKNSVQKGKAMRDDSGKHGFKENNIQFVSDQIYQTSEKIKNLSEETKRLQQKIVSTSQNLNQVNGQINQFGEIPVKGNLGSYSLQIQAAEGHGKGAPAIPHEQLLSEGLLQSILSAIEQPASNQQRPQANGQFQQPSQNVQFQQSSSINFDQHRPQQNVQNQQPPQQSSNINFANFDAGGLILPAGYEPIDRTKGQAQRQLDQDVQASNKDIKKMLHNEIIHRHTESHRGDIPQTECDLKADNSIRHTIVVPPPSHNVDDVPQVNEIDENDVAIYFDESKTEATTEKSEPVTEISVATSISENVDKYSDKRPEFGDKVNKKQS